MFKKKKANEEMSGNLYHTMN